MFIRTALIAAAAAASFGVQAQTWSTNFTGATISGLVLNPGNAILPGDLPFESGLVTFGAFTDISGADALLALGGSSTASLTFTTPSEAQFFLVSFNTSTSTAFDSAVIVSGLGPGPVLGFAVPASSGFNPGPDGLFHSYYFGTTGSPWAPGTYTITFDNLPAANGFRLDDISVSAVPEPGAISLMLAGVGVLGLVARRRQRAQK